MINSTSLSWWSIMIAMPLLGKPLSHCQRAHPGIIEYFVEQEQSIALARNRTVAQAKGDTDCIYR